MSARNDDHDNGLVHGHPWASETAPRPQGRPEPRTVAVSRPAAPPDGDDGLVHRHGWACAERGRMTSGAGGTAAAD